MAGTAQKFNRGAHRFAHGDRVVVDGWRMYVGTVSGYAFATGELAAAALVRARVNGFPRHWLDKHPGGIGADEEAWLAAPVVDLGEIVIIVDSDGEHERIVNERLALVPPTAPTV